MRNILILLFLTQSVFGQSIFPTSVNWGGIQGILSSQSDLQNALNLKANIATPTFTTSATVPLLLGGATTTSSINIQPTSATGTTGADINFRVGANGVITALQVRNDGGVLVGTTTSTGKKFEVNGTSGFSGTINIGTYLSFNVNNNLDSELKSTANYNDRLYGKMTFTVATLRNPMTIFSSGDVKVNNIESLYSGNTGIGTSTPTSTFQVTGSQGGTLLSVSTATTLAAQRWIIVTSGVLITLPSASTCTGRIYTINARAIGVTISSYLDLLGTVSTTIINGNSIDLVSDGTNWQQVK